MISVTVGAAVGALLVFLLVLCVAKICLDRKTRLDALQEKVGRAGGVAKQMGFKLFDDLCFALAAGNVGHAVAILLEWFKKYCTTESGPKELARDVIVESYAAIRDDAKYGNEVRSLVVYSALGWTKSQAKEIDIAQVAMSASLLGWDDTNKIAVGMATEDFMAVGDGIRALANEMMDKGPEEIAMRVAPKTLDVLWNDKNYHERAVALVKMYAQKAADEQAAADKAALVRAAVIQAAQGQLV